MHHGSAVLTVHGKRIICRRVLEEGWSVTAAAMASGVSRQTASKWVNRFRELGDAGLANRSTRPRNSPHRLPTRHVARIVRARLRLRWGPHRLSWSLRYPRSTIYVVLRRLGISRRSQLEPRVPTRRYEWPEPGDLIHVDTKKLGRIGPGGGCASAGRSPRTATLDGVSGHGRPPREASGAALPGHRPPMGHNGIAVSRVVGLATLVLT